ncbi:MAG: monoterpene epsilon-lactone hydrolase [Kiritimatiellia bacterium]|jgi:monoterpene epsilon-lactone hydrolase
MASWQSRLLNKVVARNMRGSRRAQRARAGRPLPEKISPQTLAKIRQNIEPTGRLSRVLQPAVRAGTLGGVPGELHEPKHAQDRWVLYFHGGGYSWGSSASHRRLTARLARESRAKLWSMDYRLSPEHPFPAGLDDAWAAWKALIESVPSERCVLAGDSAGGGLVAALLHRLVQEGGTLPAAAYLISPWVDLTLSGDSLRTQAERDPMVQASFLPLVVEQYRGEVQVDDPYISPVFADHRGWPPLLVHVGDREVLLDDSLALQTRAANAGVEVQLQVWPGMMHVFPFFASVLPEGRRALRLAGRYIQDQTPR